MVLVGSLRQDTPRKVTVVNITVIEVLLCKQILYHKIDFFVTAATEAKAEMHVTKVMIFYISYFNLQC